MTILIILLSLILLGLVALWIWIERGHILLPGTWPALKWMGFRRTLTQGWRGIWYGRFAPGYIKHYKKKIHKQTRTQSERGRKKLQHTMADGYHGKVISPEQAKSILTVKLDIALTDLGEHVIPFDRARDIILRRDDALALFACPCRRTEKDPCKVMKPPYFSCILVGSVLVDYLVAHNPSTAKRVSTQEALDHLKHCHQLGLVHSAWFKDCLNDQFYCICNCCSCCCLGFAAQKAGIRQLVSSGRIATVEEQKCIGCEACVGACPFGAVGLNNNKAQVDDQRCMGCSVCTSQCKQSARTMQPDATKSPPLEIDKLQKTS